MRVAIVIVPLHVAIPRANSHMVSLLLSAGADVNARDVNGMTPLHLHSITLLNYATGGRPHLSYHPARRSRNSPRQTTRIPKSHCRRRLGELRASSSRQTYRHAHAEAAPLTDAAALRRRLSPLRRVPPEVLRKIVAVPRRILLGFPVFESPIFLTGQRATRCR